MATGSAWLETLRSSKKTCIMQDGKRKVHYTMLDGSEMVELYDASTSQLIERKWKRKTQLGRDSDWDFEVGESMIPKAASGNDSFSEAFENPIFTRNDTVKAFQWRVRNIPYPINVYETSVEDDGHSIVLRTSNKKYFKRFNVPDMKRLGLGLDASKISMAYANNTLIITYDKPPEVINFQKVVISELKKLNTMKDGDIECNPS